MEEGGGKAESPVYVGQRAVLELSSELNPQAMEKPSAETSEVCVFFLIRSLGITTGLMLEDLQESILVVYGHFFLHANEQGVL